MRRSLAQGQYLIAGDCWDSELEGSSDSNTSCKRCGQPGAVSVVEEIYSPFGGEAPVMASFCPDFRPLSLWLLVFQGLSGLCGGGALLHLPLDLLEGSPFTELRILGLILLTVLGVGPLVMAAGLWRRRAWIWHGALERHLHCLGYPDSTTPGRPCNSLRNAWTRGADRDAASVRTLGRGRGE
jgi:hypothetical protein